ncbi:hypothetical protein ABPG72_016869 [Tetrahymena utriculariae]
MNSSQTEEEAILQETLQFLQEELEENKNFKIMNKYGGRGGFGLVLFVEDKYDTCKKYAVKAQSIINTNTGKINKNLLKQCEDEAQILRSCEHRNIVQIHSDFVIGLYHFIQMNLCQCSLQDWIDKNTQPINDMLFLHYINQIIDGIEYLHNKDYVLRDLSVRNILITTDGVIKLCDFGLAKKYDDLLKSKALYTQTARGVFLYFPPELQEDLNAQKSQIKQTKKGDIWAFGVCLMILGGIKFNQLLNFQNNNYQVFDAPLISESSNQLIKFILNKDPQKRPSFSEIREKIFSLYYGRHGMLKESLGSKNTQSSSGSELIDAQQSSSLKFNSECQSTVKQSMQGNQTPQSQISQETNRKQSSSVEQFYMGNKLDDTEKIPEVQQHKKAFSVQVAIDKNIDIDFMETSIIFNKYSKHLKDQPNNVQTLLTLGYLNAYAFSNYELSKKYFEEALQIDSDEIDAYLGICTCIILNRELKNISKAKAYLNKCLSIKKQYWRTYYIYAWLLILANKEKEALNYLSQGLQIENQSVELLSLQLMQYRHYNVNNTRDLANKVANLNKKHNPVVFQRLGNFYSNEMQDYTKAIFYYKQAYEINKKDLMTHIHLADNYFKNKDQQEAEQYLINAQILYHENSILLNFLGQIEVDLANQEQLFKKSISVDPYNKWALYNLAKCQINLGNFENGIKYYKKVLEQDPEDEQANAGIAQILGYYLFDCKKAIEHYQIAINTNFLKLEYLINLADLHLNIKDLDSAQSYINQCVQIYSNAPKIYEVLSKMEQIKGNSLKAVEYMQKQVELEPQNADIYHRLGQQYHQSNPEEAKKYYLKSLSLDPRQKLVNYRLGLLEKNDFKQQIKYYQAELSINPQNIEAINAVAMSLQCQEKYDLALQFLEKGLKRDANNHILYQSIANIYKIQRKYSESIENYNKALKLSAQNIELLVLLADAYFISGQTENAIDSYREAIQLNPSYHQCYIELGKIYEELKQYKQAVEQFEIYLQYQPNSSEVYYKIGMIEYIYLKNIQKAQICFIQSIQLNPNNYSSCYRQLGLIQNELGDYTQAKQNFLQAIEINKNEEDLYLILAQIAYNQFRDIWQAIEYLEKYLQLFPNQEKEEQLLNEWYLKVNNTVRARETYEKQIQENPQNISAFMKIASIEYKVKNYHKSIFQYNKVLEIEPNNKLSLYNIGLCFKQLQKYETAVEYFQNVIQIYQNFSLAYYQIGEIEQRYLKNPKKAIKFLRYAIELKGQDADAYFYLGLAFDDISYKFEALECFQKTIDCNSRYPAADFCKKYISENIIVKKKKYKHTDLEEKDCNIF